MLATLIRALLRRRGLALALVALVVVAAGLGALRLRVDFSSTAFYGDDSPAGEALAAYQERWGADDDTLLVLVRAGPEREHLLDPEALAAIHELAEDLRGAEAVAAVTTVADAPLPRPGLFTEPGELEATDLPSLVERVHADEKPDVRRDLLERLPFVPALLSADARSTVVAVELEFSSDDVMRTRATVDGLEDILAEHDGALAELGLERELAGVPAIRASFFSLLVHDQAIFVPATLALIALGLLLVFRRLHGVLIPALAAGAPMLMLIGIMGWVGEPVGLLNQAYFTLLPVIAVADAIHMVARFHEGPRRERPKLAADDPRHLDDELRAPSASGMAPIVHDDELDDLPARERRVVEAGSRVGLACLLTSLTTAAGFASLALAQMPMLRRFGLFAALGVLLGFCVVVVLVPLLLSFVEPKAEDIVGELPGLGIVDRCARLAVNRPLLVLFGAVVLTALALVPADRVRVDNTLTGLLDGDHPTHIASGHVDDELGGVLGLEFELHAPAGVDLRDPELLAATHGFEQWLAEQPEVRSVEGLASVVAGGAALLGGAPIPDSRAAIDARLDALAPYAPLDRLIRERGRRARIHAGLPDDGGQAFVEFAERAEAELHARLAGADHPRAEEIEVLTTGTPLLAYRGVNRITDDLRTSLLLVFAVVVVVIGLLLRSFWLTLIGLIPNALPLLLGYATVGLSGQVLDPLAAVILTLGLGIAVDDTLHILVRTREERQAGVELEPALRRGLAHSGRAVVVTSVLIAGALALNLASSFPPLQMLGLLGAVVILAALVIDLLVLPALIVLLAGRGL